MPSWRCPRASLGLNWPNRRLHPRTPRHALLAGAKATTTMRCIASIAANDFERRDWVSYSGWPIDHSELLPFYREAAERYRFPPLEKFENLRWESLHKEATVRPQWNELTEKVFLASEDPQNFGCEFLDVYERDDTDLLLDSTVIRLEGNSCSGDCQHAVVSRSDKKQFRVNATHFVLAANGIENARLLLNSTYKDSLGLGNQNDQVGRYFMNHPKNYFGKITLTKSIKELPAYFGFMADGFAGYFGLRISEKLQRERRLLNSYIRFEPVFPWSDNPGVEAVVFLTKQIKFLMKSFRSLKKGGVVKLRDYAETGDDSDLQNERKTIKSYFNILRLVVTHLPTVAVYLFYRLIDRLDPKVRSIRIRNFMEMEPHPNNRIILSEQRDDLGCRKAKVIHSPTDLDKRSMVEVHESLKRDLSTMNWGKFKIELTPEIEPWPIDADASHHMGSTRMGSDPSNSVVDRDCKIHSISNVYVAGGSVFPTSGNVNPTFTLIALGIRLANHLKTIHRK